MRLSLILAAAAVATCLTAVPATADDTIGAPGIGDSYYPLDGNGGYDVAHYDLRLSYDPATDELWGTTTIQATTTQKLSRFNLDFLLHPSSVRVNNAPAHFVSQADGELVVTPARSLAANSRMTVTVTYRDNPDKYLRYGKDSWIPGDGTWMLIADEPHIAPWWYPSNDHPSDKATYDISMAAPPGLEVISTGVLVGTSPQPNGWTRWHWRSTSPQGPFQTGVVIDDFDIVQQTAPNGLPIITAYSTDAANGDVARAIMGRTPEFVDYLAAKFGPYPFDAMGVVLTHGIALEIQTRPFISDFVFGPDSLADPVAVMVHELAHQWFGNSVSIRDWRDIWLSEGIATYAEWLWFEDTGVRTASESARLRYDQFPAEHAIWQVPVTDPGLYDESPSIAAVYYRGAMALHALRLEVGDDTFVQILRTWAQSKKDQVGSTAEFMALAEEVSGRDLTDLFHTWLYSAGKPPASPGLP